LATRVVYTAESRVRDLRSVFRDMAQGLRHSFYVGYRLCRKDIKAEHNRSALGIFWDFADPLMMGFVFYFLKTWNVIDAGAIDIPYALFVIYGLFLYATFAQGITQSLDILRRSKGITDHLRVPPEAMMMSVFYRVLFDSAFRVVVMLGFSLGYLAFSPESRGTVLDPLGFLCFLAAYPLFALVGIGVGILLAPFNAVYLDVGRLVRIVLLPLRYLSNVLFLLPAGWWLSEWLYYVNPIALFIDNLRDLATQGTVTELPLMLAWSGFFAAVFAVGWLVFHLSIPILAERS
jgi:lipopolysaccharide transport system permease protein